uniref:C2H2-type domain-containing protein n=1 Tax=Trichuris muris TaxID=70415 RepID=A0A5S6QD66_TRIMR
MSRRKQSKPTQLRATSDEIEGAETSPQSSLSMEQPGTSTATTPEPEADRDDQSIAEEKTLANDMVESYHNGGLFACTYCPYSFATPGSLKNHEQEHAALMPYRCTICGKGFKHKRSQNRHNKLHSGLRKYKCTICDSRFFRSDHLKLHMKTHEISKYAFVCVICQRGFNSNSALESHFQVYHNKNSQQGASPDRDAMSQEDALLPSSTADASGCRQSAEDLTFLECSICHLRMPNSESLLCHLDSQHNLISGCAPSEASALGPDNTADGSSELLFCVLCASGFESTDELESHSENVHGIKNSTILAQLTQLSFPLCTSEDDHSDGHARRQSQQRPFSCGFCTEQFLSVFGLQKHTLHKHSLKDLQPPVSNDPTYDCDVCGRSFESILALHCHVSTAHGTTAVDGRQNGFDQSVEASSSASLMSANTTTNASVFQCGQCDMVSTSLKSFTSHMQQHISEQSQNVENCKSKRCDLCGLVLDTELEYDTHLMSHYLQKESHFVCDKCNRSYTTSDDLQKHLFDMHVVHLYRCALCGSAHDTRPDLQEHFAMTHRSEQLRHRCRSCNAVFGADEQFLAHVHVAHMNKAGKASSPNTTVVPFYCTVCCIAFNSEVEYRAHSHTLFKCPLCTEAFDVEYLYEKHINNAHGGQALLIAAVAAAAAVNSGGAWSLPKRLLSGDMKRRCSDDSSPTAVNGNNSTASSVLPAVTNKCNICDKKCASVHELAQHKLQHCKVIHSEMCNVCRAPITSVEQFFAHIRMHNSSGVPMACVICKQSLLSTIEMHTHSKFHLRLGCSTVCRCQNCAGQSSSDGQTNASANNTCNCQATVETESEEITESINGAAADDQLHSDSESENSVPASRRQCTKRQRSCTMESQLETNMDVQLDGANHICMLCKKVFDSSSKLQCHLIEHSFVGCSGFQCYLCDRVFSMPQPLQQHMTTSHTYEERVYACLHCDQKFFFRAELDSHNFVEHSDLDPKEPSPKDLMESSGIDEADVEKPETKLTCCCCGKWFPDLSSLQAHSADCSLNAKSSSDSHSDTNYASLPEEVTEEPSKVKRMYVAPSGRNNSSESRRPSRTAGNGNLKAAQQGSHPCPHCPKVFNSPSALQGHSHVHMGSRIHQCSKCKREFPTAAKMRNHQRQHSGDKPFPCEVCGRFFSRKDNLKVHMKTHFKYNSLNSLTDLPTMVSPGARSVLSNFGSSPTGGTGQQPAADA